MDELKIRPGLSTRIFWNYFDCPYRDRCPDKDAREDKLIRRHGKRQKCSFNPGMFECPTYQKFEKELGDEGLGPDFESCHNLECL